jgi:hypothetical protein
MAPHCTDSLLQVLSVTQRSIYDMVYVKIVSPPKKSSTVKDGSYGTAAQIVVDGIYLPAAVAPATTGFRSADLKALRLVLGFGLDLPWVKVVVGETQVLSKGEVLSSTGAASAETKRKSSSSSSSSTAAGSTLGSFGRRLAATDEAVVRAKVLIKLRVHDIDNDGAVLVRENIVKFVEDTTTPLGLLRLFASAGVPLAPDASVRMEGVATVVKMSTVPSTSGGGVGKDSVLLPLVLGISGGIIFLLATICICVCFARRRREKRRAVRRAASSVMMGQVRPPPHPPRLPVIYHIQCTK